MYKKSSLVNLTPISILKSKNQSKNNSFCPSTFLNDIDSFPQQYEEDLKKSKVFELEIPNDSILPKTVRRRLALGNYMISYKSNQVLPNLSNLSSNSRMQKKQSLDELFQMQGAFTQKQSTELEQINRKIKSIINSNKRQVTFSTSHVIVDEDDNTQIVQDLPTNRRSVPQRKTHIKHNYTEI